MNDPISDIIIRLKNASLAGKETVSFKHSNVTFSVLEKLSERGYIGKPEVKGKGIKRTVEVGLIYNESKMPRITDVKRYSKLSKRLYKGFRDLHPVKQGFGTMILSTPKGILSDDEARKEKVGGEILFSIW